jgi:LmbE family N-acetylglucosaminyl deacetylase
VGSAGYIDAFGPVQAVSSSTAAWQQFQTTFVAPQAATQVRFAVELFAGAVLPGANAAAFDGFSVDVGACQSTPTDGGPSDSVPDSAPSSNLYTAQFESGPGGWADGSGTAPTLGVDGTSSFGPAVMSVTRTGDGGDYFSPWIEVTGSQTYCAKSALKWAGTGGMPFIAIQPSYTGPIWIVGSAGYIDAFGPVQAVSSSTAAWQQFQTTFVAPQAATQVRFAVELFAGGVLPGANSASFDGFSLTQGACGTSVIYAQDWEHGVAGWADGTGNAPALASDGTSAAGSAVMSVTRSASNGDYFSPWIAMTGGQVFCVEAAVRWLGGGMPFIGLQTSSGSAPMWIIGASGNRDDQLGPLQGVSYGETGWQQFRYTAVMPEGGAGARLAVELLAEAGKDGSDQAYFDGFKVTEGACVTGSPTFLVQYAQEWESGAGAWTDGQGNAPAVTSDNTSRAGPGVMSVSRTASAADYFSPWADVAGGQTYCVQAAVRWLGGGTPFVGLQPSTASAPVWIIGASGYSDAFGPVKVVDASATGWQQFQYAVPMPVGATQARLAVKLSAEVAKGGADQAYFDGFRITNGGCAPSSVLVMAPHPDDEIIISSGVIGRAVLHGDQVHIAFLTNGDYNGTVQGFTREDETTTADGVLGVGENNLRFLGYPDGYTEDIRGTYTFPTDVMTTPNNGVSHTYAARGLGRTDYHSYAFGAPAAYNWPNVLMDVASVLSTLLPDSIYVTSGTDGHPDHRSAYYAIVQALPQVIASHPGYKPTVYTALVDPGDETWPNPAAPDQYFKSPAASTLAWRPLLWTHRDSLDVPLSMQTTTLASNVKYQALAAEVSQGGNSEYLGLFLHKDEPFWGERPADPGNLPPVVNAGLDQTTTAGATVTLSGSASFDPDGVPLSYKWSQVDGPAVALSDAGASRPTFAAPSGITSATTLTFELRVADDLGWSAADAVKVIVNPAQ